MSNCPDLCTAAKCEELERRIKDLESKLEQHILTQVNADNQLAHSYYPEIDHQLKIVQLENEVRIFSDIYLEGTFAGDNSVIDLPFVTKKEFSDHVLTQVNADSNLAHTYDPEIDNNLSVIVNENNITLVSDIFLEGKLANAQTEIPLNNFESNLKIDGTVTGKTLLLSIADGNSSDTAEIPLFFVLQDDFDEHLRLDIPEAHNYEPLVYVNAAIESNTLFIDVAVNDSSDVATVELSLFEPLVNVSLGIEENTLFVDVAVNDSSDTGTIELPVFEPLVYVNADILNDTLFIDVAVNDSSDVATVKLPIIDIPDMNCDELETALKNGLDDLTRIVKQENDQNQARIDGLGFQLDLRTGEISDLVNQVLNELNQSFIDSFIIGGCQEKTIEVEEEETPATWGEAEYKPNNIPVAGAGIMGIAELIKVINSQISALHKDLCSAIPPNFNLKNVTPLTCLNETATSIATEEFLKTDTDFNYLLTEFQGEEPTAPEPNSITLRKNLYQYLAYKLHLLQEQQINLFQITCNNNQLDVVSIIANDKVVNRVSSTQLILHFVTLNNYPKRSRNSSYRPVQIPGARKPTEDEPEPYKWSEDFEDFYWIQGNQYAELRFEENYAPVSGWFESEEAANIYFAKVLTLTTATKANIVIPKHSDPKTNIPVRTTRPYRAFICELNQQGQNQCLAKYYPPIEYEL